MPAIVLNKPPTLLPPSSDVDTEWILYTFQEREDMSGAVTLEGHFYGTYASEEAAEEAGEALADAANVDADQAPLEYIVGALEPKPF